MRGKLAALHSLQSSNGLSKIVQSSVPRRRGFHHALQGCEQGRWLLALEGDMSVKHTILALIT